ncbi:ABC transporter substrate-binding protein [Paeniglutamicibacter psychrophenolicus]|uniref:Polar amino acid transport system substrate-binding protein n=1 Tax=Paeniglutamicibacter psychrophenolicus TaxID=257454 RepID=A0ABS4WA97_9MICC|nr:ABC transporter substrate-binding protein [Paeniglutamicibacter psychrophenolicus]MBP2373131.1 polar amino acid transport system substrate-binding protein [Paeniglutamicibacter psychrophenolicus]
MKSFKRGMLFTAVLTLGAAALTGCGGQSLAETPSASGAAEAGAFKNTAPSGDLAAAQIAAITVDSDLAARVPEAIKTGGLKIAAAEGYPPMEMFDTDGKTMVGVDMSLARAMGNLLGVEAKISNSDVSGMMPGVVSGRFDVLMSGFNDTAERREKVSFVDYAKSSGSIMVAKGNPEGIKSPADLCGETMAVLDNGYYMQLAEQFSKDCEAKNEKPIKILGFANDPEALLQVQNGRAVAGLNDYPVAVFRAKESNGALEAIEIPGSSLFGIAIDPKNEELVKLIQDTMNKLIEDGTYTEILGAWELDQMALPEATVNQGK